MPQNIVIRELFTYTKVTCQLKYHPVTCYWSSFYYVIEVHFIISNHYLILYCYNATCISDCIL